MAAPLSRKTGGWNMAKRRTAEQAERKRETEKKVIAQMIALYCKGQRHTRGADGLCPQCRALTDYVIQRSDHCPFMAEKTFCSNCRVHCYAPKQREQIRAVMRYAAPRMLYHRPIMALHHVVCSMAEKRRLQKDNHK